MLNKHFSILSIALLSFALFANGNKEAPQGSADLFPEGQFISYPLETSGSISYWVGLPGTPAMQSENLGGTPYGKALRDATGIEVEWLHPVEGQSDEQLNLLIAAGDLPDIIEYNWITSFQGGPEKAVQDGVVRQLNDLIERQAPHYRKYLEENRDIEKLVKTDTGKLFSFPFIRGDERLMVFFGMVVNKSLMNDVGIEALPETIDDWYVMLKAFKDAGVQSPLTFESWMLGSGQGSPFASAFGTSMGFHLDEEGKVAYGPVQPGFKDFLSEFAKWFDEGLLDRDITTVDRNIVLAKMSTRKAGAAMGYRGSRMGAWIAATEDLEGYEFAGTKYPVINRGDTPKFGQMDFPANGRGAAITSTTSKVELATRFLDFGYSEDGHNLNNFGIPGESYEWIEGYPKMTDLIMNNPDYAPSHISHIYLRSSWGGPFIQDFRFTEQSGFAYPEQRAATDLWAQTDMAKYRMPLVTPTPDESDELNQIMSEVNTYQSEMFWKFIFGAEDLNGFDDYVNVIKDMGIDRAVEIQQSALDRFNAR